MVIAVILWCHAGLTSAQPATGAGLAGAVGIDLPLSSNLGMARHFPQGEPHMSSGSMMGARILAFPELTGLHLRQLGGLYSWKVYHAAAYADFFGDHLFGWQHFRLAGGLPLGKVRFGSGLGLYRWWVSDQNQQQWQANFGFSGTFKGAWQWHMAYQTAFPTPTQESMLMGAPVPTAFLALSHAIGPVQLWATYMQRNGSSADYGIAVVWKAHKHLQLDLGVAPSEQRFSLGAQWLYNGLRWHLQFRWLQVPGIWFDNTLLWRKENVP